MLELTLQYSQFIRFKFSIIANEYQVVRHKYQDLKL